MNACVVHAVAVNRDGFRESLGLDVGAKDPGGPMDSREIYQEGVRWAHAQVAACRTGEARFQAILDRFGYDTYVAARDEIYRQSEALERQAVAALADGTYQAEGCSTTTGSATAPYWCGCASTSRVTP